jgi:cell fate (sporulation/competence/biofilm development) regulator YlbF (YheA/YmcA/DUF963 family)
MVSFATIDPHILYSTVVSSPFTVAQLQDALEVAEDRKARRRFRQYSKQQTQESEKQHAASHWFYCKQSFCCYHYQH